MLKPRPRKEEGIEVDALSGNPRDGQSDPTPMGEGLRIVRILLALAGFPIGVELVLGDEFRRIGLDSTSVFTSAAQPDEHRPRLSSASSATSAPARQSPANSIIGCAAPRRRFGLAEPVRRASPPIAAGFLIQIVALHDPHVVGLPSIHAVCDAVSCIQG
jgi:hypothetical protein